MRNMVANPNKMPKLENSASLKDGFCLNDSIISGTCKKRTDFQGRAHKILADSMDTLGACLLTVEN